MSSSRRGVFTPTLIVIVLLSGAALGPVWARDADLNGRHAGDPATGDDGTFERGAGTCTAGTVHEAIDLVVNSSGERGALGIAFPSSYDGTGPNTDLVYIYYTTPSGPAHNRLSRFTVTGAGTATPTLSGEVVLRELPSSTATNHNGGATHFGPDGKLYIAVGDHAVGGSQGSHVSQTLTTPFGKILRLDPDGTNPGDNPFDDGNPTSWAGATWALGLRNPFTFAFETVTGRMFINDVGQNTWEEINDGVFGGNYGWAGTSAPVWEGFESPPPPWANYHDPLMAYDHSNSPPTPFGCSIAGGAFYPAGSQFGAAYAGKYFFADFCGNFIRLFDPNVPGSLGTPDTSTDFAAVLDAGSPVDLKVDTAGNLYYLGRSPGQVRRISFSTSSETATSKRAPLTTLPPGFTDTLVNNTNFSSPTAMTFSPVGELWVLEQAGRVLRVLTEDMCAACGNGIVEAPEQCDDGNNSNGDGCDANCVNEVCGNGIVQSGEQCDDGNTSSGDGCSSTCQLEFCGDGVVQAGEQCDDGNTANGDGCDSNCVNEVCGNGVTQSGEQCDDGNTTSGDGCSATCVTEFCGDGTVQGGLGEQCDDGNTTNGDGCDSNCIDEVCGNGIVQSGEECDDGNTNDNDVCANDCTINPLANHVVNGDFAAGTAPWVFFTTGGGTYQVVGGEAKLTFTTAGLQVIFYQDNVALAPNTEYTLSFRARHSIPNKKISASFVRQTSPFPSYGLRAQSFQLTPTMQSYSVNFTTIAGVANDGRLRFNLTSAATPGTMIWFDDISLTGTSPAVCGNGIVDPGEQCDDGNTMNGDGCDSTCQIEPVCGNGIVEAGEQCDDGNTMNGDGCDSNCQIEVPVCGNGIVDAGEECDDGNLIDGDGCDSNCTVTACGNGITTPPEECDDGNANDNDACANDCTINSITNAIVNGDFSAGEPPWIFFTNATGTFDVVDGEGKVTFGDNGFNVQLYQRNIAVDGNTDYTLTFRARHTGTPRRIQVRFARHTSPFTFYGLSQNVDLTSTMETYTLPFTTTNDVITDGRLMFILGRADRPSGAMFIVDDVVLAPTSPSTCGNGVLDPGETCDGANLDGETCSSQGLDGGTLACNATCDGFDTSGCFDCGNGVVDGTEECDGSDLDGETCSSQGFDSGTLSCTGSCTFNTGACATCGDGVVGGGEQCDDGNTTSGDGCSSTCQTEGGGGPNLIQNPDFSSGEANWRHSAGTGSSDFSVVGGQAFVEIFVGGNNLQVYQSGITLQPNTTYRLTFDGRNTGGDDIRARVIRHSSPYTNYGLNKFVNLTQSMQTFTMTFTTPASVASARLQLWFIDDNPGDNYYFDNFVLELD